MTDVPVSRSFVHHGTAARASAVCWRRAVRVTLLGAALAALAGCVTSQSTRSADGPPGRADTRGDAPTSSNRSPNSPEEVRRRARIRLELAAGYYQQGQYSTALEEARTATTIDPNYSTAYGMVGLVQMAIGDQPQAEAAFRRGLQIDPKDAELNNNYGWYLCQAGQAQESIAYFERAIEDRHYTTPAKPLHNAGICMRKAGDDTAAEQYFLRSFQIDPSNAVALFNLSDMYLRRGNTDRAKFYSDRLLSANQPTAETLMLGLRVAQAAGDRDQFNSLAQQLRNRFPESPEAAQMSRGEISVR